MPTSKHVYNVRSVSYYVYVRIGFFMVMLYLPVSSSQKERTYSFCGTIEYMAPEIIRGKSGHGKVNILKI